MQTISLIGPAYETVPQSSPQKTINWYLEELPNKKYDQTPSGLPVYIFRPTPGVPSTPFATISGSLSRAGIFYNNILYIVVDDSFYEVDDAGSTTLRGTLSSSTSEVRIVAGYDSIIMVDGVEGYVYNTTDNSFSIITSDGFPDAPSDVAYLSGYFAVITGTNRQVHLSRLGNPTLWEALDVAEVAGVNDVLLRLLSNGNEIWMFGERGIEPWYLGGDADSPLQKRDGAVITMGTAAPNTTIFSDSSFIWLGRDRRGQAVVLRSSNYTPNVISTDALSSAIEGYATIDDAYAFSYRQGLHEFYVLTFPTENITWVYDLSNMTWHQRTSYNNGSHDHYRWKQYIHGYNKHLLLDERTSNIYYFDMDTYTEVGNIIKRVRVAGPIHEGGRYVTLGNLIIVTEPGVGTLSGQGSDPQVMLRVSKDSGHTWGNVMSRSLGRQGEYTKRATWITLGRARYWAIEMSITDPVNAVITAAYADMFVGGY